MMSKAWDGSIRTTDSYQPFIALTCEIDASMHSDILDDVKHCMGQSCNLILLASTSARTLNMLTSVGYQVVVDVVWSSASMLVEFSCHSKSLTTCSVQRRLEEHAVTWPCAQ